MADKVVSVGKSYCYQAYSVKSISPYAISIYDVIHAYIMTYTYDVSDLTLYAIIMSTT